MLEQAAGLFEGQRNWVSLFLGTVVGRCSLPPSSGRERGEDELTGGVVRPGGLLLTHWLSLGCVSYEWTARESGEDLSQQ